MSTNPTPRIAVIGGSLTGPTTALLLRHAGYDDVTVYEATPAAVSLAGGVIGLDHMALDVLEDHLGIGQDEIIPFTSERVVSVRVLDRHTAGMVRTVYPGRNTTWTALHTALMSRLPHGTYQPGKRVRTLTEAGARALLTFADGDQTTADLVVFADGRRSTGRALLDPTRRLRYAGYVAHRGAAAYCPPDLRDFTRYEPGAGQFTMFPVAGPAGGLATDWTLYGDATPDLFADLFGAAPTRRMFVLPHQVTACARRYVDTLAARVLPDEPAALVSRTTTRMAAPVVDIDPPTRMVWPVGSARAVLIGDALAPVRPHTARGANNGIEQAAGLAVALGQHRRHGADLDAALVGWESRNLPVVAAAVAAGPVLGARLGLGTGA